MKLEQKQVIILSSAQICEKGTFGAQVLIKCFHTFIPNPVIFKYFWQYSVIPIVFELAHIYQHVL